MKAENAIEVHDIKKSFRVYLDVYKRQLYQNLTLEER